jgi:alginate O-acetyltransferase complex protein AlgI
MVFTSNLFLFLFLPLFLVLYYILPFRAKSPLILIFSYVFYGWWRPDFAFLLLGVSLVTYLLTLWMESPAYKEKRMSILTLGVVLNLAALGYFKYFNFGVDSFNILWSGLGFKSFEYTKVILPIGLSFYIFQAMSYMVDVYRGDAPKTENVFDFLAFISFFPQLVAGPVLRYQPLADQFLHRTHSWRIFSQGCLIFMAGFCGKVLIADPMAPMVDAAFAIQNPSFSDAWLGITSYTIQLFFDFSGYSTMAIGLGLMVGFVFPKNFDDPYISASITEFWRRWHMSLSEWLKCYLYIPLGGNRYGRKRNYINLFLTMVLGGLWHGANWTFVLWGVWHGGLLALEKYWRETHPQPLLPRPVAVAWTMLLVMIGWVFFRAADVGAAFRVLGAMMGLSDWAMSPALAWQVAPERLLVMGVGVVLAFALPWIRKKTDGHIIRLLLVPLFLWAVATLSSQAFTPFLYFQF